MNIRTFQLKDLEKLKSIHIGSGFDYPFPDVKELIELEVLVDDNDEVVMGLGARVAAELYMWIDGGWETPGMRFELFKFMHEHMRRRLKEKNIHWVNSWLPPIVSRSFGRRLIKTFGWARSHWPCFTARVF